MPETNNHQQPASADDVKPLVDSLPLPERVKLLQESIDSLPLEEKAELLQKTIGKSSGLMVVFGLTNSVTADMALQIQTSPGVDLSVLMEAIAGRIRKDSGSNASGER